MSDCGASSARGGALRDQRPLLRAVLVLAVVTTSQALPAQAPARADAVAIVRAVIAAEATAYGNSPGDVAPCVITATDQSTFDGQREYRTRLARTMARHGADPSLRQRYVEVSSLYGWQRTSAGEPDRLISPSPAERRSLTDAVAAIIAQPPQPRAVRAIEAGWLTEPYRLCGPHPRQPALRLTSPAIRADLAFVAVEFDCVMCGRGTTYALRRTRAGWAIIAEVTDWVS